MKKKKCFKCEKAKSLNEFYKHSRMADGYLGKCKECAKSDVKNNYVKNFDRVQAYEKKRAKTKKRINASKRYLRTAAGKKSKLESNRRWRAKNREKVKAHSIVARAIKRGDLSREPCSVCGAKKTDAHHHNYSLPLEVTWLCPKHHREMHDGIGQKS